MIYKEQLDALCAGGCGDPECTHHHEPLNELFLHAGCHSGAGAQVEYQKGKGTIIIRCRVCKKFIADIAVASAPIPLPFIPLPPKLP